LAELKNGWPKYAVRRNAVNIIQEILAASIGGISKTRAVYRTNLNFTLMEEYLGFLTGRGYLQRSQLVLPVKFTLTMKGRELLRILIGLEEAIAGFRVTPQAQERTSSPLEK